MKFMNLDKWLYSNPQEEAGGGEGGGAGGEGGQDNYGDNDNGDSGNNGDDGSNGDNGNGTGDAYILTPERAVELKSKYADESGNLNVDAILSDLDQSQAQRVAPESYSNDFFKSEQTLQSYEIADDDPIISATQEWAKENGISQEQYQALMTKAMTKIIESNNAVQAQSDENIKEAWAKIPDAEARKGKAQAQLDAMFSEDFKEDLSLMVNHPKVFPVIESLLSKIRDPQINDVRVPSTPALSENDIQQLRVQRDAAYDAGNGALAAKLEKQISGAYDALAKAGKLS